MGDSQATQGLPWPSSRGPPRCPRGAGTGGLLGGLEKPLEGGVGWGAASNQSLRAQGAGLLTSAAAC